MLGYHAKALPSTEQIVSQLSVCSINTRQLELLLSRVGPTAQHLPLNVCLTWFQ